MAKSTILAMACICLVVSQTQGQVVQLPTIRNFSIQGGASVPDAGTGTYGGSRSGRWSRRSTPLGRSLGGGTSAVGASVRVDIIDLKAMDDAILNRNTNAPSSALAVDSPAADGSRNYLGPLAPQQPLTMQSRAKPDAWQRTMAGNSNAPSLHPSLAESNIRFYLRRGKQAEALGRINASRVYYRMAIEAMTPDMLERYRKILDDQAKAKLQSKADAAKNNRQQF